MTRLPNCGGCGRSVTICVIGPCLERQERTEARRKRHAERLRRDALKIARKAAPVRRKRERATGRRLATETRNLTTLRKAHRRRRSYSINAERWRAHWQRRAVEMGIGA